MEILAKIGYQLRRIDLDDLFAENFIYKFLNKFNNPFVVEYIKEFTCPNINNFLTKLPRDIDKKLREIYTVRARGFNILLTKMCSDKCKTLHNLLITRPDPKTINAILLQCMYALVYFQEIGLQHNDLHMNNIFVEENPSNITLKFNDKIIFNFSSKYIVKIYDFDYSSIVPTRFNYSTFYPNGRIDTKVERGLCISNKSNHGQRDTAQFLLNFSRYNTTKLLELFVKLCLPEDLIDASEDDMLPHPGHPCKLTKTYSYELFPDIKSAKTAMRYFHVGLLTHSEAYLPIPDKDLNLISPILPSLAQNCKEYTDISECIKPTKPAPSLERRQKFIKALIKASKSL